MILRQQRPFVLVAKGKQGAVGGQMMSLDLLDVLKCIYKISLCRCLYVDMNLYSLYTHMD